MTAKFYEKAFEIIRNGDADNNSNKTLWILSQLGDNSLRPDELLGPKNQRERSSLTIISCRKL